MMAIDETDYVTYPASKFYRKDEIKKYFRPFPFRIFVIKEK